MKPVKKSKELWLYGRHPVTAALQNPKRKLYELLLVRGSETGLKIPQGLLVKYVAKDQIEQLVGREAVHQGMALRCDPLPNLGVEDIVAQSRNKENALVVVLDQVTDPHNIGAIMRSAAAFNACAVVVPETNAPEESGVLAKSASGTLELVPLVRVTNIVRAMEKLKQADFWCLGMDGYAKQDIYQTKLPKKCVVVMGAEGDGMRRLTAENCDYTVKLPMNPKVESLNVSNACAITLYEWYRQINPK